MALIEAAADGLFKLVIAAPLIGGVLLVTIVIGTDTDALDSQDWRVLAATVVTSLVAHQEILVAFLLAMAVVIVGGSLLRVLVKGGTVGVLVHSDLQATDGDVSSSQLFSTAGAFSVEAFIDSARLLFPRYARLVLVLTGVYLGSAGLYLVAAMPGRTAGESWLVTSLAAVLFVCWTTLVNLAYLLMQVVMAADDCGLATAARRVLTFARRERRLVASTFGVFLGMVVLATGASLLAFTVLSVMFVIPLAWLAVVPLQLIALLLRAIVFEYIDLASIGTYLTLYRNFRSRLAAEEAARAVALTRAPVDGMLDGPVPPPPHLS